MSNNINILIQKTRAFGYYLCMLGILISCQSNDREGIGGKEELNAPNIIFLLADDLGYGDLGCYGSQSIETPHLDSLASEGMKFTRFYAASAVCSPSRASLMTGKFPLRYDVRRHFRDSIDHLPTEAVTIAELLKQTGYATCHVGKWHLGGLRLSDVVKRKRGEDALPGPLEQGFDHYLSNIEGRPIRNGLIKERQLYRKGGQFMLRNDERAPSSDKHWTELKVDEAISWLGENKKGNRPFFLNLWFDVPHTPYEPAPEPHLSKYEKQGVEGDQLYFRSMVSHLDAQIGRLINYLKKENLFDNTLIVFTSDNGPAYQGNPGPFKGGKTDLHEGGIRVPMFAVWPEKISANSHSFQTMHMVDLLPTLASITGFDVPESMDGIDMLSILGGDTDMLERPTLLWQMDLYTHFQNQGEKPRPYATTVAMNGNWKLLADSITPVELFHLGYDHREIYNVLGEQPEIENQFKNEMKDFLSASRLSWKKRWGEFVY